MTLQRVAVTGASGFVGRHLCAALVRSGHRVTAVVRSTSRIEQLQAIGVDVHRAELNNIAGLIHSFHDCSAVFHLAGAVDFGSDWPRFHQVNVVGTANVIAAAQAAGVPRLVHCSSIVAVGASRTPVSLSEEAEWNLGPMCVPYVSTKHKAEMLALNANSPRFNVV